MDIVVWVFGRIGLNYVMNAIEIDSSGDHIGCEKTANLVFCEIGNYASSPVVFQFAVDTKNYVLGVVVMTSKKLTEKFGIKLDGCTRVKEYDAFAG